MNRKTCWWVGVFQKSISLFLLIPNPKGIPAMDLQTKTGVGLVKNYRNPKG